MASITSLSNSASASSIYGNRNILSGLASGMDTESMIENAVSGIKTKIQSLIQKRTKVEWQQEAYRSIIDKAATFNTKYTSYTSKTNLLSSSFFTNAVNTAVNGTYADKITASGKSSSDIKINAVKQLATSASYTASGMAGLSGSEIGTITGSKVFNIGDNIPVSNISGSLTFQYGGTNGTTFDIKFDELENVNEVEVFNADGSVKTNATNSEKLMQAIKNKLSEVTYTYTKNGFQETTTADKAIKLGIDSAGRITFADGLGNGNSVKISSSTGNMRGVAGENAINGNVTLTRSVPLTTYLADKTVGFTLNGTTKTINLSDVLDKFESSYDPMKSRNEQFQEVLQGEIDKAFGAGKITAAYNEDGKLTFSSNGQGDVLTLGGTGLEAMGFETGDANYINTGKKLTDILGDKADSIFSQANRLKGTSSAIQKTSPNGNVYYVDSAGNSVDKDGYRLDSDGNAIYDFEVNGTHINVTEDTTLESLMNSINSNAEAGVKVSYSKLTNEFKFTTTETGANSKIEFGGMAAALFGDPSSAAPKLSGSDKIDSLLGEDYAGYGGDAFKVTIGGEDISVGVWTGTTINGTVNRLNQALAEKAQNNEELKGVTAKFDTDTNSFVFVKDGEQVDVEYGAGLAQDFANAAKNPYVSGQDAIMDVEINGMRFENLTRSSNSFDLDGLTVNVKSTFEAAGKDGEAYEPITFETTTDTEKIIDAIREFVNDYNEMATELKNAYSTQPLKDSSNNRYDPLTSDEEAEYSESELAAYNEKAKTGILFGDTTLSSFYSKLLSAISPGGTDGQTLREIGISTSYSDGMTTLSLDEDKLRTALENDPDKVKNAFTKTKEGGSASDGLMQTMQNTLNTYVKTTGEPKGVLITRAGSVKAPTSLNSNTLKSQIDSYDSQIERWQDKMSTQIDRYTTQFSRLEQLIAQMNSQASAFAGLMGGDTGY